MRSKPFDWIGFFVHFVCAALVGAGIGLKVFLESPLVTSPSYIPITSFVGLGALICGLIAGFIGDAFWRNLMP